MALYDAILILFPDGTPLAAEDCDHMASLGGYYDEKLAGMVFADTNFPAAMPDYMTMRGLKGRRIQVDYDPEWFAPPWPDPVWEDLPAVWDGTPPVIGNMLPLRWLWVCSPDQNDGHPFDVLWLGDDKWTRQSGGKFTPQQAVEQHWKILATSAEVLDMAHKRLDEANAKRLDRASKDAIANDFAGTALQVAMTTGRISLRAV